MNQRRKVLITFAGLLLSPLAARAQGKVPRIAVLTIRSRGHAIEAAFIAGLKELGYVEGRTIAIEWRYADGKAERLPALAAELVKLKPALIVAASTQSIEAAKAATTTIPIVFPANADPVGGRFVQSLARPGGNITGLSTIAADLGSKQIELLRAVQPRLSRIAMLVNPTNLGSGLVVRDLEASARKAGIAVQVFKAQSPEGIDRAFAAMAAARVDAVTLAIDGFFNQATRQICAQALRHKLPFISTQSLDAEAGGLMSYGGSLADNYRRAATYVDKILKGAKPADLPVEQPMAVELVLNLKTAKALGLTIPASLRVRADRVIE